MSEIHKHTSQFIYLDVYGGAADALPAAVLTDSLGATRVLTVTQTVPAPTGIDQRYSVTLTMADTQSEGELFVSWTFAINSVQITKVDNFDVVTPYLTITEVKKVYPEATDAEAIEVEAAVRHIINAHTGQTFGFSTETISVEGHGERALRLPKRLVELTGVSTLTYILNPHAFAIVSDGWFIKKRWSDVIGTRLTDDEYFGEDSRPAGIITAPSVSGTASRWKDDYPFDVTGDWGYKTVPYPVKEAARLLVNDYACSEIAYRDRYLESIKAADWRLQYSNRAWEYTGNVRADQLLSEYVILDWAII